MRSSDLHRFVQRAALVATVAVLGAAAPRVMMAQGTSGNAGTTQTTTTDDDDDGRGKWGYLGLLGLLGLIPRGRKDTVHHTDSTTTRRP